LYYL
ncbi:hypothetical protein SUGI_0670970, partial [Cryptomeria japonica]|jgi:histone acetyltransferase